MSGIRPARDKRTTSARHRNVAGIMIARNAATRTPTADSRLPRLVSMEPVRRAFGVADVGDIDIWSARVHPSPPRSPQGSRLCDGPGPSQPYPDRTTAEDPVGAWAGSRYGRWSSRGRTRTCDPLTRNGHGRVLGIRKLSAWRPGNPDENPETGPNRTRPTVPTPYPAKKSATREV